MRFAKPGEKSETLVVPELEVHDTHLALKFNGEEVLRIEKFGTDGHDGVDERYCIVRVALPEEIRPMFRHKMGQIQTYTEACKND